MQELNGPEAAGHGTGVLTRQMRSWEEDSRIVPQGGWQIGCADRQGEDEETQLVGGHSVWSEFVEAAGLDEVQKIVLLDHNGVVNRLGWREAVEVSVELDHVTAIGGGETRVLLCSYVRSDYWVRRVLDSEDTRPVMASLDGFVFVDSRESGNGPMVALGIEGRPSHWIWLKGGDKSAVSRLTGKPTFLFDDRGRVLLEHSKGNCGNEGVRCGGRGRGDFPVAWTAQSWVWYVKRFLDRGIGDGAV